MTLKPVMADELKPLSHGFFTREGGASSGIFAGLNCGFGSSDQHDAVAINRGRVAEALGVESEKLITIHQVHSSDVVTLLDTAPESGTRADALVTNRPGIALAILTADCQPVLFADHEGGVIGAAHAGWKGALDGVLESTIDAMVELGAKPSRIAVVIGPSISQRAYEVGPEFFDRFYDKDPEAARFFARGDGDRMLFDLPSYGMARLRAAGVGDVRWTGHCTYSDPTRFYSYRRSVHRKEADYGRLIAAIRL